jgi:hypothetical protein
MNQKNREARASWAIGFLLIAMLLGADAWANRLTSDYYHEQALLNILGFVAVSVSLFTWNAIQYALHLRKK